MADVLFSRLPGIITGTPFKASSKVSSPGEEKLSEVPVSDSKIFPALSIK